MLQFFLDLLFPPPPLLRGLLQMDAAEFSERAPRAKERAGAHIISLFEYAHPLVRRAVWELKYRGNKKVAALLASVLYDELLGFLEEYAPLTNFTEPLLIPIPLSRKRERERGFNQCVLLADELARLDAPSSPAPFPILSPLPLSKGEMKEGVMSCRGSVGRNFTLSKTALRKIKDTPSQTKTDSRAKRLENLHDCFAADPKEVSGRNIILIDDVATTGATLAEARRALRKVGARKVIAFTIAH